MNGDLISREALVDKAEILYQHTDSGKIIPWSAVRVCAINNTPAVDAAPITGETSDGYHTFNELYHHRAVLFSVIVKAFPDKAWKARKHHDGSMYDGMFIVGIETPDGQATYHYDIDPYWDMFDCSEVEFAPEWDGHTAAQAIERIGKLEPVVHGRWIPVRVEATITKYQCSQCSRTVTAANDYFGQATKWIDKIYPYCHCGAKMDSSTD